MTSFTVSTITIFIAIICEDRTIINKSVFQYIFNNHF